MMDIFDVVRDMARELNMPPDGAAKALEEALERRPRWKEMLASARFRRRGWLDYEVVGGGAALMAGPEGLKVAWLRRVSLVSMKRLDGACRGSILLEVWVIERLEHLVGLLLIDAGAIEVEEIQYYFYFPEGREEVYLRSKIYLKPSELIEEAVGNAGILALLMLLAWR